MKILETSGDGELATVFIASLDDEQNRIIEFVESTQPPVPADQKLVLIVSTMLGCPVACLMCDAGGNFKGKLTKDEIMEQIDFLIKKRFNGGKIQVPKLKIQFARMGEPSFNAEVLNVMKSLPETYDAPGIMPCISTVAPASASNFFSNLMKIKNDLYGNGMFQLQFSIHTTDKKARDKIIPCKKWGFKEIADFGSEWFRPGDRKITLNFAPIKDFELDPNKVREIFDPDIFYIKLTPVNPTYRMKETGLESLIETEESPVGLKLKEEFETLGYKAKLSIGELAENQIGSNCGFYISRMKQFLHR